MQRYIVFVSFLFWVSCTISGNKESTPPLPQQDSSMISTSANFGKIISFFDTLIVYNASTGDIITLSQPYGSLTHGYNTTVNDSLVYQNTPNKLVAINMYSGQLQFMKIFNYYGLDPSSQNYPVFDGLNLYMTAYENGHRKLFCVNKKNGVTVWKSEEHLGTDAEGRGTVVLQNNDKIFLNYYNGPACFRKSDGALIWHNNSISDFWYLWQTPVLMNDKLIEISVKTNIVYALDIKSGNVIWQSSLPKNGNVFLQKGMYVYNNKLYIQTEEDPSKLTDPSKAKMFINIIDANTGNFISTTLYQGAVDYFHFYDKYFYTFSKTKNTFFPQRVSKYLLVNGNIIWTRDFDDGGINSADMDFITTPGFIYCLEEKPYSTSGWRRVNIIDQNTGKTLKTFPVNYLDLGMVVVDSLNNVYHRYR